MIADECISIDRFGAIMTVGRIPYNFSNDSSRRSLVQAYGMRNTIFSLFTFRQYFRQSFSFSMFGWDIHKIFQSHVVERMVMAALSGFSSSKIRAMRKLQSISIWQEKSSLCYSADAFERRHPKYCLEGFPSMAFSSGIPQLWSRLAEMSSSDFGTVH